MPAIVLEVCIESVDDAVAAVEAGADRLELNSALRLGGLSPSLGTLIEIRRLIGPRVPLIAMVRPREGDFCYSEREFDAMRRDLDLFLQNGANGVALGVLLSDGRIDRDRCRLLVEQVRAHPAATESAVFHRAFDFVVEPLAAIDELAELGFTRILTSGQCETASEGAGQIVRYLDRASGRIEILPAAGIRPENVETLIRATGCRQVHGSLREPIEGASDSGSSSQVRLAAGTTSPRTGTSGRLVRAMRERLDFIAGE